MSEEKESREQATPRHSIYPYPMPAPPPEGTPVRSIGINRKAEKAWDASASHLMSFSHKESTYGKPPEGSLTEQRAVRASQHINNEMLTLVSVIRGIGKKDETNPDIVRVTFGRLFEYYTAISNKVVGILLRARRWGLVDFPGEMLYQRQDDKKIVTLLVGPDVVPTTQQYESIGEEMSKTESLKEKLAKLSSVSLR
ncbi:actin-binding Rho-activating protein-like isoform X2 [Watersipora subatra]